MARTERSTPYPTGRGVGDISDGRHEVGERTLSAGEDSSPRSKDADHQVRGPTAGGQGAESEPEILEGLARDIVSRLASSLFGEEDMPPWAENAGPAAPNRLRCPHGLVTGPIADTPLVAPIEGDGSPPDTDRWEVPVPVLRPFPRRETIGGARQALLRRGTVRSGRQIRHNGDVVVLGDVNPGGQVVAAGDVVVMGTLRGTVHAGATGDYGAVVAAFRLCPTQLRIASYVARPPEEPGGHPDYPELALVRDGVVVVKPLTMTTLTRFGAGEDVP